ncbi:hypothetical protein [Burkholderia lata]|uniref:hypothetical protein n=1 Tax=Burkholderia lata (strain ATCC 17760 / DSM 23089 / LMG 22485 / NCIMB 9086 / R18194 / 383) TaxID=482957 RepID=UPI003F68A558
MLMALCSHTDKHGWAWPSRKTLAEKVSVSTARVSQLRDWGYIEVYAQARDSDGRQHVYTPDFAVMLANGERRTANGERRTANGERRTASSKRTKSRGTGKTTRG